MTLEAVYGLVDERDPDAAYLFECDCEPLFAITRDRTGANLPSGSCLVGWRWHSMFALGPREGLPRGIDPGPVLRGLRGAGYYIWREGRVRNPPAGTQ